MFRGAGVVLSEPLAVTATDSSQVFVNYTGVYSIMLRPQPLANG